MEAKSLRTVDLGLAFGFAWGLGMLALGLAARICDWGTQLVTGLGSLYIGYAPTFTGSLIGGLWGLADGFVWGALIALGYNWLGSFRN